MFNKTIIRHEDNTLPVQERIAHERTVSNLNIRMSQMVSPETMQQSLKIADRFRKDLVFEIYKSENSVINFIAWQDRTVEYTHHASFILNGERHTVSFSGIELAERRIETLMKLIAERIAEQLAGKMLESMLKEEKE